MIQGIVYVLLKGQSSIIELLRLILKLRTVDFDQIRADLVRDH